MHQLSNHGKGPAEPSRDILQGAFSLDYYSITIASLAVSSLAPSLQNATFVKACVSASVHLWQLPHPVAASP